jgi:dienelactone hydrolase
MHKHATTALLLVFAQLAIAQPASPSSTETEPAEIEPARRDLWSRGSVRFHRQWSIAGVLTPEAADKIPIATLEPAAGRSLAADVPEVRWAAHTSWGDITELNEVVGAPKDARRRVAFVSGVLPRERDGAAMLAIGVQGAVSVWLNGEQVHERKTSQRAFARDSERIPVQMRQGDNSLLLRLEQADPSAWPFAVRVLESGALLAPTEEIVPYLAVSGTQVNVHTDLPNRSKGTPVEVAVVAAGGRVLATETADRGEVASFDAGAWPDGAYELRAATRNAWGEPYFVHLPWYKGDAASAAQRLIDAASSAGNDIYGAHVRLLAEIVRDRAGGQIDAALPGFATRIHSPLTEYEELQLDRAQQTGAVRAGGFVRLGYRDEIDGSVQFCRAYLPTDYAANRQWPLVLALHGYNPANPPLHRWWSVDQRHSEIADRKGVIYIEPHGRGNAQYLGLGQQDVLRCLEHAKARLSVDEDRVYLTGESMGGHGTWAIASRNPQLFAAAAPVYGGWDFRVTSIAGPAQPQNQPRNPREFYIQERSSSFSSAENLLNVPLLVIHGDKDAAVSVENSRHAAQMLQRWGYDIRYWEMPGWAHEDLLQRSSVVDWLLTHRREGAPHEVRVRATDLAAAQAHWLQVRAMQEPQRMIRADAQIIEPGVVRIDSENVAAFTLALPQSLRGERDGIDVVWNGARQRVPLEEGEARVGALAPSSNALHKRANLQGPISDVVNTPFMVVVGTSSRDARMRTIIERHARDLQDLWEAWQHHPLRFKRDVEVTREDERVYSLILLGGPDANAVTRRLAKRLPLNVNRNAIEIDGKRWQVSDAVLQMIYPSPVAEDRYVLVVAGTSAQGMALWMPTIVEPSIGVGLIGTDWTIEDGRRPPPNAAVDPEDRVVAAGSFDVNWRRDDRWTTEGDASLRAGWRLRRPAVDTYAPTFESLSAYAGDYDFGEFTADIAVRDGKLMAQTPFGPPLALTAHGEHLFRISNPLTRDMVEFVRDANGTVIGAEVDMQGRTLYGRKVE